MTPPHKEPTQADVETRNQKCQECGNTLFFKDADGEWKCGEHAWHEKSDRLTANENGEST